MPNLHTDVSCLACTDIHTFRAQSYHWWVATCAFRYINGFVMIIFTNAPVYFLSKPYTSVLSLTTSLGRVFVHRQQHSSGDVKQFPPRQRNKTYYTNQLIRGCKRNKASIARTPSTILSRFEGANIQTDTKHRHNWFIAC